MTFSIDILLSSCNTIYDLLATMYSLITSAVPLTQQAKFVRKMSVNKEINDFSEKIFKLICDYSPYELFDNFPLNLILKEVNDINKGQSAQTIAPYLLSIIQNIDSLLDNISDIHMHHKSFGPLNEKPTNCFVYLRGNETHQVMKSMLFNRQKVGGTTFQNIFSNFIFILQDDLPRGAGAPSIEIINNSGFKDKTELRIAYFPWGIQKDFSFIIEHGIFHVAYQEKDLPFINNRISSFLENAIQIYKPNIIVFPEYSIPHTSLSTIKSTLVKNIKWSKDLMLVIAGSTWIVNQNQPSHNNVSFILDRQGKEIGKTYKYSQFVKRSKSKPKEIELIEDLTNPGLESTIIHIPSIGLILPSICRDAIDGDSTLRLGELFLPAYIFIPAYSKSVASFKNPVATFCHNFHSNIILCNHCESVDIDPSKKPQIIGFFSNATIENTTVEAKNIDFLRNNDCIANFKSQPCYFCVKVNWNDQEETYIGDRVLDEKKYFYLPTLSN